MQYEVEFRFNIASGRYYSTVKRIVDATSRVNAITEAKRQNNGPSIIYTLLSTKEIK